MREYELEVLEQYHIDVESTRKIRGAFFCDTDLGTMALREVNLSEQRAQYLYLLCRQLEKLGYANVDTIFPTMDGHFLSHSRDGKSYILKKWYSGNECDVKNEREILLAIQNLAFLHNILYWKSENEETEMQENGIRVPYGVNQQDIFIRHNQELSTIRKFVRNRSVKNNFESLFLKHYDEMYEQARSVTERFERSSYRILYQEAKERKTLTHGDYNYHNVIFMRNRIATTNFDKARIDVQVSDLVYFIRKVMEKQKWNSELGIKILSAYIKVRPLSDIEKEYIWIRLSYPEKFWKTANSYYLTNKSWIPIKMEEKLRKSIVEVEEKRKFLDEISTFFFKGIIV